MIMHTDSNAPSKNLPNFFKKICAKRRFRRY